MPPPPDFPHLHFAFQGSYEPKFQGGPRENPQVDANRADPKGHATRLRGILGGMRRFDAELQRLRAEQGLPAIPADRGFLLKLPEGIDVDQLVRALGVELVAETEEGLMLVSSSDLEFTKLEEILAQFEAGTGGLVAGSSLLDIYEKNDDERRLRNILAPEIFALWPLVDATIYIFDLGIQTAASSRDVKWPQVRQKKNETEAEFRERQEAERRKAWEQANTEWDDNAEIRVNELMNFIQHYRGEITSSIISDPARQEKAGMVFPDSVQLRVKMTGSGFRDVILNFAHLFDVNFPPDVQQHVSGPAGDQQEPRLVVNPPEDHAPTICVIDSGIEEGHRWLAPAIHSATSRCFLPGTPKEDVADYVQPSGHGTRVAGAVLYPHELPTTGEVQPVAWIQNARVLNAENKLPDLLPPEDYLQRVVAHFHAAPHFTKVFNHSINANAPCPRQRMTSWGAKLDQLSHEQDVLFIQSVGNQNRDRGNTTNPGLCDHLEAGRQPPDHQLEASMRVANPGQSLHALTVGSISRANFEDADSRSFAGNEYGPSGFSRAGYGEPWSVVKPEVVEIGGDFVYSKTPPHLLRIQPEVAVELLNSTMHGAPAHSKDGAGTSYAAPKVAHIAAHLQALFPAASPLLYRALIAQSARWPAWAENEPNKDKALRLIGYGLPSLERATTNSDTRITLITPDAEILPSKRFHLYSIRIPEELRNPALEAKIRIDITLAYTALPRRTRARRTGYLETWLDWETSRLGEPRDEFLKRMQEGGKAGYTNFPWTLHTRDDRGEVQETSRNHGSMQKDWAEFDPFNLPEEFAIAVRSHKGWNHLDGAGSARYCLVVSFEVLAGEVPIYSWIESEVEVTAGEVETRITT